MIRKIICIGIISILLLISLSSCSAVKTKIDAFDKTNDKNQSLIGLTKDLPDLTIEIKCVRNYLKKEFILTYILHNVGNASIPTDQPINIYLKTPISPQDPIAVTATHYIVWIDRDYPFEPGDSETFLLIWVSFECKGLTATAIVDPLPHQLDKNKPDKEYWSDIDPVYGKIQELNETNNRFDLILPDPTPRSSIKSFVQNYFFKMLDRFSRFKVVLNKLFKFI